LALPTAGIAAVGGPAAAASPASPVHISSPGAAKQPVPEWPSGGQGLADDRFQPDETVISVKTAARLTPRWTLAMAGDVSATPAVVNGVVYVPDWGGYLSAIRAANGHVIWRRLISSYNGIAGSVSRTDPVVDGATLVIGTQAGADIIAVNTATGARKWITRADGHPYAQITGAAIIDRGVVYVGVSSSEETAANNPAYKCCTFRGSLVALSESTGKVLWKTYTVPANGGKQGGYSGGAVWGSTPAIDRATDSVYIGTGNNYTVPAAAAACVANAMKHHTSDAKCTAPNDYFDSVLALNLKTGKVNWGRKVEGYDAWTAACLHLPKGTTWCPSPAGQDSGPRLARAKGGSGYNSDIVFVPDYRDGQEPFGVWTPAKLLVAPQWADSSDPEFDVGFVVLQQHNGENIQQVLGADRLGTDLSYRYLVHVTGYPDSANAPIACVNWTSRFSSTQLRFDCADYTGGTSGSPRVTKFSPASHTGTIVGVIGGYQQGGDTPAISYSVRFGPAALQLYQQAVAAEAASGQR
jgi:outer membrane protein assembly factor BamB